MTLKRGTQRNITGGIINVSIKCLLSLRYFRRKIITAVSRSAQRFVLVGTDILLHLRFFRERHTLFTAPHVLGNT